MQEFKNSAENHLGMPLPKGRVRFYRRDDDGQLEFTGENEIDHTPKDELIRIYTGNAFDLTGATALTRKLMLPRVISQNLLAPTLREAGIHKSCPNCGHSLHRFRRPCPPPLPA